jgi:hypothetical protein
MEDLFGNKGEIAGSLYSQNNKNGRNYKVLFVAVAVGTILSAKDFLPPGTIFLVGLLSFRF